MEGDRIGDLERQLTLGSEDGYVLVRLGLIRIFGIVLGLALRSCDRIGVQRVGLPMDYHGSEGHLEFVLFDLDDATGYLGALGNYRFSFHLDRLREACVNSVRA